MIPKSTDITSLDGGQLANLKRILDNLHEKAAGVNYTNVRPTATTVPNGTFVVHEGTDTVKRVYTLTGQVATSGTIGVPTLGYMPLITSPTTVNAAASGTAGVEALVNQLRAVLIAHGICV